MGRLLLALIVVVGTAAPAPALEFPSAQDVINRVLTTARTMDLASAAVAIELFLGTSGNASPACVFRGVLRVSPNPTTLAVAEWTPHPLCWTIERFVLGRLLSDRDQAGELLRSFRFEVLGEKLEDGRPHYLVYGKALAAQSDALSVIGWVDYDRGLVTDGTIRYAWGEVTAVQEYGLVGGVWILAHQQLRVPGFGATLEISYSGYRFLSRP